MIISDDIAAIVESYVYRAYGEPTINTADGGDGDWFDGDETTATSSAYANTILFTGRNYEPESGLYYYRARMYDLATGRFRSRDPIGYAVGMCLYAYVDNAPTGSTDPSGLTTCCKWDRWAYDKKVIFGLSPDYGFVKRLTQRTIAGLLLKALEGLIEIGPHPPLVTLPSDFMKFQVSINLTINGRWKCKKQCLDPPGPVIDSPFNRFIELEELRRLGRYNNECMLVPGNVEHVIRQALSCVGTMTENLSDLKNQHTTSSFTATCDDF